MQSFSHKRKLQDYSETILQRIPNKDKKLHIKDRSGGGEFKNKKA